MNKKLVEIKQNVDSAYFKMKEILELEDLYPLSRRILSEKKESLKNLIEEIRITIEDLVLNKHKHSFSSIISNGFLERLLTISERLRVSYAFPGYQESYYIMDTLKSIDGERQ